MYNHYHYLYRWIDIYGNVVYVGETKRNLNRRLNEHFSCNPRYTNFTKRDINKIHKIEYIRFNNDYEAMEHERYYISLWRPRLNKAEKYVGVKEDLTKASNWKTKKVLFPLVDPDEYKPRKLTLFENIAFYSVTAGALMISYFLYYKF